MKKIISVLLIFTIAILFSVPSLANDRYVDYTAFEDFDLILIDGNYDAEINTGQTIIYSKSVTHKICDNVPMGIPIVTWIHGVQYVGTIHLVNVVRISNTHVRANYTGTLFAAS